MNFYNHLIVWIILWTTLVSTPAFSRQDSEQSEKLDAIDLLSHDYANCAAFFFMQAGALQRFSEEKAKSKDDVESGQDSAAGYFDLYKKSLSYSTALAAATRNDEIASKVTKARFELAFNSMSNEIDRDFSNFSILMNKYLNGCIGLMSDPEEKIRAIVGSEK